MIRSECPASQPSGSSTPLLELRDLCKSFGETFAVDHVSLTSERGQILALLGENGAGKSTVIKLLAGIYQPDHGSMRLNGQPINHHRDSQIAFIHQDHGLVDTMTIAENIALVRGYDRMLGLIDWRSTGEIAERALQHVGLSIDPAETVSELSRTERSLVAIARALAMNVDLLVLDEPTASLPAADVERLFEVLQHLRERGVGMIYVTHRIDEVFRIADRVAVMRDGRLVTVQNVSQTSMKELVNAIVGRPLSAVFIRAPKPSSEPILDFRAVQLGHLKPASFSVMAGELIGLTGLRGAGHELLGRALAGILPCAGGEIRIHGRRVLLASPRHAITAGVAFITSNREEESLAPSLFGSGKPVPKPLANGQTAVQFPATAVGKAAGPRAPSTILCAARRSRASDCYSKRRQSTKISLGPRLRNARFRFCSGGTHSGRGRRGKVGHLRHHDSRSVVGLLHRDYFERFRRSRPSMSSCTCFQSRRHRRGTVERGNLSRAAH